MGAGVPIARNSTYARRSDIVSIEISQTTTLIGSSSEERGPSRTSQLESGRPISDEDFESATSALEASTASIEKQCQLLEAQKKALLEIQTRNVSNQADGVRAQRSNKFIREKSQAEFEATELAHALQSKIARSVKQSEGPTDGIQSTVERVLEKDDRLLDGLQKVLPQLSDAATGSERSAEIEKLCQAMIAYSSAEIHARIDSAFHTAAQAKGNQTNVTHPPGVSSQSESLQAELEELCREIDGLSTMVADAQYRNPILNALKASKSESEDDKMQWMQYMSSTLQHLIARLECLDDGTQQLRSQNLALKTVSSALDGVLAMSVERKRSTQALTQSPSKPSQRGLKPLRLVQANLSESQDPAAQLLRHLDVRVADSRDSLQLAESLEAAVKDKHVKLTALSARTETAVTDQLSRTMAKADANSQALCPGVYAYSPFDTVNLVSGDVTEGIDRLEQKTQSVSDGMRELVLERLGGVVRERQRVLLS